MSPTSRIQIRVADDELEVWASLCAGDPLRPGAVESRLSEMDVTHGLDRTAIDRLERSLESENASPVELCIARGTPAIPARSAKLRFAHPTEPIPGVTREDGSLDFRERCFIVPVEREDVIAYILPPFEGEPGRTVRGAAIAPEPASALELRTGEGVRIDDDRIVATRAGAREIDSQGQIDVIDLFRHTGSVDTASGNLTTTGSLEIARDVMLGMHVRASGDLHIGGMVDGGIVEAAGNIEIKGGAIGREAGRARAGGHLSVRHALGMDLMAKGRIHVTRGISTSTLHGRKVVIDGRALSNEVSAEESVRVQSAGSPSGGPCRLRAAIPLEPRGFDPTLRPAQVAGPSGSRKKSKGRRNRKGRPPSRAPMDSRRGRSQRTLEQLHAQADLETRVKWRRRQQELRLAASIEVIATAHAGCHLTIGEAHLVLAQDVVGQTFRLDDESGKIRMAGSSDES